MAHDFDKIRQGLFLIGQHVFKKRLDIFFQISKKSFIVGKTISTNSNIARTDFYHSSLQVQHDSEQYKVTGAGQSQKRRM